MSQKNKPPENAIKKVKEYIEDKFDSCFDCAIKQVNSWSNMWRYLVERFPIYVDEQAPQDARDHLEGDKISACFTGDYIAVSKKQLKRCLVNDSLVKWCNTESVRNMYSSEGEMAYYHWFRNSVNIEDEILTTLAHEFTHILCEHHKHRKRHLEKKMIKSFPTYILAEEIQANRGYGVMKTTIGYGNSVTEDNYPETKGVYPLWDIYKVLLKHKAETEDAFNQAMQELLQESGENNDEESGSGSDSQQSSEQSTEQKAKNQAKEALKQAFKQAIRERNAEESFSGDQVDLAEELGLDDEESSQYFQPPNTDTYDGSNMTPSEQSSPGGQGAHAQNAPERNVEPTPIEKLKYVCHKRDQQAIAKALAKMRGVIKGEAAKTKTKTYSRPPRRQPTGSLFRKGIKRDKRANPSILLALDSSGSMHATAVTSVAATVDNIVKTLGRNIDNCYICVHDSTVSNVKKLRHWREVTAMYSPCGGNNFGLVYEKAQQLGVDVVLNVGDGLDNISGGNKNPSKKPIKWFDVIVSNSDWAESYYGDMLWDINYGYLREPLPLINYPPLTPELTADIEARIRQRST